MSAPGQTQKSGGDVRMSAKPPTPEVDDRDVRSWGNSRHHLRSRLGPFGATSSHSRIDLLRQISDHCGHSTLDLDRPLLFRADL